MSIIRIESERTEMRFPLDYVPPESWHMRPRCFGASRGAARKHAGCDLYGKPGTPVYAVAKGTILNFTYFYQETYALTVDHGKFLIRYGEIDKTLPQSIKVGTEVTEGDLIGTIGDLAGIAASMLHFEMYSGTASGPLTVKSNPPYMRRRDLLDPTDFLDELARDLGGAGLRVGDVGGAVMEWQKLLLGLGYSVALDGEFGSATAAATRKFQGDMDLPKTGAVDDATRMMAMEADKQ